MHWIRIDRYYEGDAGRRGPNLVTHFQPRAVRAVREGPVRDRLPGRRRRSTATDGLNDMVYNRCVGTRYCSNNCPYKVRRFNFLHVRRLGHRHAQAGAQPGRDGPQPRRDGEVHVLRAAHPRRPRSMAEREQPAAIRDGEILTACQAACPSEAIVFGDLNDPTAPVSAVEGGAANYGLLAELNTMPRTTLPGGDPQPEPRHADEGGLTHGDRGTDHARHPPAGRPAARTRDAPARRNKHDLVSVGDAIGDVVLGGKPHPRGWWIGFLAGFAMLAGPGDRGRAGCSTSASASGASTSRSPGASRSSTSCGGSASATPAR